MTSRPPATEILIVHTWGIGDLIMLTTSLRAAHTLHPEARFTLLFFPKVAAIPVVGAPYLREIIFTSWRLPDLVRSLVHLRRSRFDAAMFSSGVTPWKTWLFMLLIKSKHKIAEYKRFKYPLLTDYLPASDQIPRAQANYLLLSRALPLPSWQEALQWADELKLRTEFRLSEQNLAWAESYIEKQGLSNQQILGIHPGCMAKNKYRRWPAQYFIRLIELVERDFNCQPVIIAGPDELDAGTQISQATGCLLLDPGALADVAAFISRCSFFVNTDSGLGHIASCFSVPSLTIFGPGNEKQTAPFSERSEVIRLNLDCAPCVRKGKNNCSLECLVNLQPETVYQRLKILLEQYLPNESKRVPTS